MSELNDIIKPQASVTVFSVNWLAELISPVHYSTASLWTGLFKACGAYMFKNVSSDLIKGLAQLSCIADEYQEELQQHCYVKDVAAGGVILRKKEQDLVQCYLVQGEIEVWHSFNEREYLNQNSVECQQPLNDLLFDADVIRAKSRCQVLRVNSIALGRLMALSVDVDNDAVEGEFGGIFEDHLPDDSLAPGSQESYPGIEKRLARPENLQGDAPRQKQKGLDADYFARAMSAIFTNQITPNNPTTPENPATCKNQVTTTAPVEAETIFAEHSSTHTTTASEAKGADGDSPSSELSRDQRGAGTVTPLRIVGR